LNISDVGELDEDLISEMDVDVIGTWVKKNVRYPNKDWKSIRFLDRKCFSRENSITPIS